MDCAVLDGLSVPTYFVNQIVVMRTIGPCVQVFWGAAYDGCSNIIPEFCQTIPRDCAISNALRKIDFLRATLVPNVIPIRGVLTS